MHAYRAYMIRCDFLNVDAALNWLNGGRDLKDPARGLFGVGIGAGGGVFHVAVSYLPCPR
jgi:hypothetical protein